MIRIPTKLFTYFAVFSLLGFVALSAMPSVHAATKGDLMPVFDDAKAVPPVAITLGKAEIIDVPGDVADVLVANPLVVDVMAVQSNRLYVVGLTVGDTNIIALDSNGDVVKRVDLHVKYDLQAIQALVESLFPGEDVKVASIHDQILLTGTASTPEVASKIANIVGHYVSDLQDQTGETDELISNLLSVRGEQQVTLQVKIIEAQRNVLKELGVETNANDQVEGAANILGQTPLESFTDGSSAAVGLIPGQGVSLSNPAAASLQIFKFSSLDFLGTTGLFLNALEEQSLINVLAEPNLTAVSGEQAGFLAGGETPVPEGLDQQGNVVVTFRQFGVSLNFRPIVLSDDRISLQLNTEVSSINYENAVPSGAVLVPGFDIRRADTTVELPSGGTIMIAGLLQSEAAKGFSGIPGISQTPVLGDLVKSKSFQRDETELVVLVTPYLVEPFKEKNRSEEIPRQKSDPLATAFVANIRRAYELEDEEELFAGSEGFGYLLD